jgi:leucyl-tRNA synthetase
MDSKTVEETLLSLPEAQKWLDGKTPKKIIYVNKKIINVVL